MAPPLIPAGLRFWSRVQLVDTGCWLWTGSFMSDGYPKFNVRRRAIRAHRWAYEAMRGPVPSGLVLDHLCHTPACVNPAHLEAVTVAVNNDRSLSGPHVAKRSTACANGHLWTEANTRSRVDMPNTKVCRICAAARQRKRTLRLRAALATGVAINVQPSEGSVTHGA